MNHDTIKKWLEEVNVHPSNYKIKEDNSLMINQILYLCKLDLTEIPFPIHSVKDFNCTDNPIISCHNFPHIVKRDFCCESQQLNSLEHTINIRGDFFLHNPVDEKTWKALSLITIKGYFWHHSYQKEGRIAYFSDRYTENEVLKLSAKEYNDFIQNIAFKFHLEDEMIEPTKNKKIKI
jgi:hypothetical protein